MTERQMTDAPTIWELFGAGLAAGGTAVWALAAAARVGVLRVILDIFPRAWWDAVTWVLIPALLLVPIVVQGWAVAVFGGRRRDGWLIAAAAVVGSLVALAVFGTALLYGVRSLPRGAQQWLGRYSTEALIFGFVGAIVAGWLLVAARLARLPQVRWLVVPVSAILVAAVWAAARHVIIDISYVLDRPEANGFFAAVALGGAAGSARMVRNAAAAVGEREGEAASPRAGRDERRGGRTRRRIGASHGA
jgi:hypothetical protein